MKQTLKFLARYTFLIIATLVPSICFAWSGKVVSVSDGDTLKVLHYGKEVTVRLYGIDAPEKRQNFGTQAQSLTRALVAGRNVEVHQKDVDRYGRTVGLVTVDGQSLNELIIQNGYAWVYRQYCKENFCLNWIQSEAAARSRKKGMWSDPEIIPPWEWRHKGDAKDTVVVEKPQDIIMSTRYVSNEAASSHNARFKCDGRTYCSQMTSCQEATFFINNCPGTKMDGNNDGVPCEKQWCK